VFAFGMLHALLPGHGKVAAARSACAATMSIGAVPHGDGSEKAVLDMKT
jgi:hypothetical protein